MGEEAHSTHQRETVVAPGGSLFLAHAALVVRRSIRLLEHCFPPTGAPSQALPFLLSLSSCVDFVEFQAVGFDLQAGATFV